jgi:hypothetical protein
VADPKRRVRLIIEAVRSGLGREVDRATLLALCEFDVWLPTDVPADLVRVTYTVMEFDDETHGSIVRFSVSAERYVRVESEATQVAWGEFPPTRNEDEVAWAVVQKGQTVVRVVGRGLSDDEFDLIVRTLQPAAE